MNASGCGAMIKEYGHLLRHDAAYAAKAARISELTRDHGATAAGTRLDTEGQTTYDEPRARGLSSALHVAARTEDLRRRRSDAVGARRRGGAHSPTRTCAAVPQVRTPLLQRELAEQLRDRKLRALMEPKPDVILSANIGCIAHLAGAANVPVRHWIEWLDARLASAPYNEDRRAATTGLLEHPFDIVAQPRRRQPSCFCTLRRGVMTCGSSLSLYQT